MPSKKDFNVLIKKNALCCRCLLRKTCQQVIPGKGPFNAKIMFIGEAPGKKEDLLGEPFIGASGKLLDKLLLSIQLKRSDIFITNIVKCRPPENRDPSLEEIQSCSFWLEKQIAIIKPKLLVTLGRYALKNFIPHSSLPLFHGKITLISLGELKNIPLLPLYHPAAALYNGSLKETLFKDFKQITDKVSYKK
ncbi:MAG: uracil-DNA glycosylase [Candidatus Moranbacteria bacterium]|nr:uracil-DNA glycosylase [Candidatus Moranbacteria bacterium]